MAISHNHSHMDCSPPPFHIHTVHITEHIVAIRTELFSVTIAKLSHFYGLARKKGLIFIIQSRAKHERAVERKHIKVTDLWPKKHSQPHSTQLQTPENACRGSPARALWGFVSYALKYVYIAIKVWYCASWQQQSPPVTIGAAGRFTSDSI